MAREVGEIRRALKLAAAEQPGCVRELAQRANVGYEAAQRTVENMRRAGQLAEVDTKPVPWRRAPVKVYGVASDPVPRPARPSIAARSPDAELQIELMRLWR